MLPLLLLLLLLLQLRSKCGSWPILAVNHKSTLMMYFMLLCFGIISHIFGFYCTFLSGRPHKHWHTGTHAGTHAHMRTFGTGAGGLRWAWPVHSICWHAISSSSNGSHSGGYNCDLARRHPFTHPNFPSNPTAHPEFSRSDDMQGIRQGGGADGVTDWKPFPLTLKRTPRNFCLHVAAVSLPETKRNYSPPDRL